MHDVHIPVPALTDAAAQAVFRGSVPAGAVYPGKRFDVRIHGWGSRIAAESINGKSCTESWISFGEGFDAYEILLTMLPEPGDYRE